ncbi:cysteine desulfurase family protein [Bradyrhizobium sp. Ec3.3]|uniref:cysteine desulfurase family protein n=1 Tax=Bradyrhizobium sp. Ec3.3 TaxID=189753 RepID=UPI0004063E02|nr:cysteine desulfurase family protein [Bradyrhizobium sp. Ec3.3]
MLSAIESFRGKTPVQSARAGLRGSLYGLGSERHAIYLDANATAAPLRSVIEAVSDVMRSNVGNPASAHGSGAAARRLVEAARDNVSQLIGGMDPESIIFLSGGTEANNTVIGSFLPQQTSTFLVAPVEHASVIEPLLNWGSDRVSWLKVDSCGRVDPDSAREKALEARGPIILLLQAVNSETGVIQPVDEVVQSVRAVRPEAFVHLDAAQGVGRIRLDRWAALVNSLSFSGHKIHGPLGTGALVIDDRIDLRPLILGGGQERGLRSGTVNVPGLVGLGVAARIRTEMFDEAQDHMRRLRDSFEAIVSDGSSVRVHVNGGEAARVSNTSNLQFNSMDGMQLLAHLDAAGVMASQGSACSSGRPAPSRVLRAMGLSERDAFSSLRFSFSVLNTDEDARDAADIVNSVVRRIDQ